MASSGISPGLKGQKQTLVCEHNVAGHVSKFSTPSMIQLMEQAAMAGVTCNLQPARRRSLGGNRGEHPSLGGR